MALVINHLGKYYPYLSGCLGKQELNSVRCLTPKNKPAENVWKVYFSSDKASQPEQGIYLSFTSFQLLQSPYLTFEQQGAQAGFYLFVWCPLKYSLRVHCSLVGWDLGIWFVVSFPLHPHTVGQFQPIITSHRLLWWEWKTKIINFQIRNKLHFPKLWTLDKSQSYSGTCEASSPLPKGAISLITHWSN